MVRCRPAAYAAVSLTTLLLLVVAPAAAQAGQRAEPPELIPALARAAETVPPPSPLDPGTTQTPPTAPPDPSATQTPTGSPTETTAPTSSPTGTGEATPTVTESAPTVEPTGTGEATAVPAGTPSSSPSSSPTRTAVPGTVPAVQQSQVGLVTGLLALGVLAGCGVVLWLVSRTAMPRSREPAVPVPVAAPAGSTALLVDLGEAMIDAGYPVAEVQDTLQRVLAANGVLDGEVIVLPTAVMVSVPGQETVETAVAAAGTSGLRLDQVDAVVRVADAAAAGSILAADARSALRSVRDLPAAFGPVARTLGYGALSVGLALILDGSAMDLLLAGVLGLFVGALLVLTGTASRTLRAVLPLGVAAAVSTVVLLLGRADLDIGVMAPLVAPLVMFLPGALLTTSVIELATGQLISGAGRLAGGLMQLTLLALGIVAGAQLVGVPATAVDDLAARPLGDLAPWIGVAVFGAGVVVHQCAPRASIGWILLVLYVAYGAQIIGGVFLGAMMSAFVGALVMTPVAAYVATRDSGPTAQVSFLPAFWLLVPGSLGLVGVTKLLGDDLANAMSALVTTGVTMIAISFGVLIGRAIVGALPANRLGWAGRHGA